MENSSATENMTSLIHDLRYSVRMLRKNFLFFVFVVLILAIGIGVNTAIFSLMNAVIFKSLPFSDPDRIVTLWETNREKGITANTTSASNFIDWRDRNRTFSGMAAASRISSITLLNAGPAEEVAWCRVSQNFFDLLGVIPHSGRPFLKESHHIAISYGFWQRSFGGDKDAIGRSVRLDNRTYEITAILPQTFESPIGKSDVWAPFIINPAELETIDRGQNYLRVFARLKSNINLEHAQQELNQISKQLSNEFPDSNRGSEILMISLKEQMLGRIGSSLFVALIAVISVLLIACANVASLVLTHYTKRSHEIAIRIALGASRKTLARELLIESLLMSLSGGLVGLLFARLTILFLLRLNPEIIPQLSKTQINWTSLLFTFGISVLTGIIFGILPALRASEPAQSNTWKIRNDSEGRKNNVLRNRFVVCEVAIALFLLVGAGLFIRSFYYLHNVDPGFDQENLLVARIRLDTEYAENGKQIQYFKDLVSRLKNTPGIVDAGAVTVLPMNSFGIDFDVPYQKPEDAEPERSSAPKAKFRSITSDYFRTMGIPVLNGRAFQDSDTANAPRAVIINQDLAKRVSPDSSPVGKRIRFFWADWQTYEIVGVVKSIRTYGPLVSSEPELFVPLAQIPYIVMNVVVRTTSDPVAMSAAVRQTFLDVDPKQPLQSIEPMTALVKNSTLMERYAMLLVTILSMLALILAIAGIYATVYFVVINRKSEMGIRMALGATSFDILKTVMMPILFLTILGILFGQVGIVLSSHFLSTVLFGISPTDIVTLVTVSFFMIAIAAIGAYIPARKATKFNPAQVLKDL
jgi:putative ABC transport system permease protein